MPMFLKYLVLLDHALCGGEVLAVIGGGGGRRVLFDPLELRLHVVVELLHQERLLQLLLSLGRRSLELLESRARFFFL